MTWNKKTLNNLFFIVGVVAVVVMLFTFDVSFVELWEHICHAGWWLVPIIGIWIVVYGLNALAWRTVIKANTDADEHVSMLRIFRLTITGYALNYATPVGGLGGEPYRIMELSRDISKEHATSSVILYAMMHFFAHFWLWFSSIFLYLILVLIGDLTITVSIAIMLGLIVALCLLAFYVFSKGYRNGVVVKIMTWLTKVPGLRNWSRKFIEKHDETLHNIDKQIAALFLQDKKAEQAKTADSEQAEKEKLRAEADWKIAKAKMSEMQVSELEGTMHRAEDVEAVTNDLVYAVRSNVLSLPGRLAMDVVKCETAAEASALIREHCNNILEDLANYQYDPDEYRRRVRERQGWKEETVEEEPQQ